MKKLFFAASLIGALALVFVSMPNQAEAQRWRRRKCARLASQVNSWSNIRNNYIRRWNNCKAVLGWSHPRCRRLRNRVTAWYRNVNSARANHRAWGCRFAWGDWSDPWAAPAVPSYANARCAALGRRVVRWRNIRNGYINRWNNCKAVLGWSHPRCRRLRNRVSAWYRNVRSARRNYSAWGCRFRWNRWSNPW